MSVPDPPRVCVGCWTFRPTLVEGFVPDVVGFFGKPINLCRECLAARSRPMARSVKSELRKKPDAPSVRKGKTGGRRREA